IDGLVNLVPAHVGDFQPGAVHFRHAVTKESHGAGEQVETGHAAVLFTMTHQRLHADTDGQHRLFGDRLCHHAVKTTPADLRHAVADSPDPGEHHPVGFSNFSEIGSDDHLGPRGDLLESLAHRMQVAHAIVDDDDAYLKVSHWLFQ